MPVVVFRATPAKQTHLHRKGGRSIGTYAGEPTTKIVEPHILRDGDETEMDDFEVSWCLSAYPENFHLKVVSKASGRKRNATEEQ